MGGEEFNLPETQEKYKDICFKYNYYDAKQKALKVFMNTFYGEAGNKNSPFFILQIAGGITSAGQKNIKAAQTFVENLGCQTHYGDSVTGDTPVLVKSQDNIISIQSIDSLGNKWAKYDNFKANEPDRKDKQQSLSDLQIWSDGKWANIVRVIRHKTNKKLFRVNTPTGCIDVT